MAVHRNANIERQTVILDGNEYHGCTFNHCNLIYKAQDAVKLEHCHIVGCTWQFEDAALRAVTLLKGIYLSGGSHGKEVVEAIFRSV